jgi:hypothetical protein
MPIARRAHIHADGARRALPARCREAAGSPYRPRRPSTVLRAPHQNKRTTTGWASLGDHTRSSIPRAAQRVGIMSHRAAVAGFEYVESERSFAPRPRRRCRKTMLKGLSWESYQRGDADVRARSRGRRPPMYLYASEKSARERGARVEIPG